MMNTYYQPVSSLEHMLYPGEIAKMYNIMTTGDNPADRFLSAYLKEYCTNMKEPPLYYAARSGMRRVYSGKVYRKAIKELEERYGYNKVVQHQINGKNYNFIIRA